MFWLLSREVLYLRGELPREQTWDIAVDLFMHRELADVEKIKDQQKRADRDGDDDGEGRVGENLRDRRGDDDDDDEEDEDDHDEAWDATEGAYAK